MSDQPAAKDNQSNADETPGQTTLKGTINPIETIEEQERPGQNSTKENHLREKPKWTDVAIVFLTCGIVYFAFVQWREMVGTGTQTDKLIIAANKQAGAADSFSQSASDIREKIALTEKDFKTIADRAQAQVRVQTEVAKAQIGTADVNLMPWTGMYHSEDQKRIWVRVRVKNYGGRPADSIRIAVKLDFLNSSPKPNRYNFGLGDFKPAQPDTLPPLSSTNEQFADVTKQISPGYDNRQVELCVWGIIRYRDFTGATPDKKFCRYAAAVDVLRAGPGESGGWGGPYGDCTPP